MDAYMYTFRNDQQKVNITIHHIKDKQSNVDDTVRLSTLRQNNYDDG